MKPRPVLTLREWIEYWLQYMNDHAVAALVVVILGGYLFGALAYGGGCALGTVRHP